ncbi:hypothetical protein GF345_02650 [Candidatus Woesearchaeota archaeon]|nr:hypothetical protein [Candidatus Woesearchaeota archaeon]
MEVILARYGEIALKGRNRIDFENQLKDNIKRSVKGKVKKQRGRVFIYPDDMADSLRRLRKVFGLVSISPAYSVEADIDSIKDKCLDIAEGTLSEKGFSTFRISLHRSQKKLKPSPELEKEIGALIVEKTGKKVKLKEPDLEISVEISDRAYVFSERISCVGGIPAGIEGKAGLLVENRESVLAGLLAMKRGCSLVLLMLKSTPHGDESLLEEFGCQQEHIHVKDITEADEISEQKGCRAIITGQQFEDVSDIGTSLPVLRPLVGISPEKAEEMLLIRQ